MPLRWLGTAQSWGWLKRCRRIIYHAAELSPADKLMFPFSFGSFIGFWMAFEAAADLRNMAG